MKCDSCQNDVNPEWKVCPNCGEKLQTIKTCPNCGKELEASWNICPFCGNDNGAGANLQDVVMKTNEFVGRDKIIVEGESSIATKTGEYCQSCGRLLALDYFKCKKCGMLTCLGCSDNDYPGLCVPCKEEVKQIELENFIREKKQAEREEKKKEIDLKKCTLRSTPLEVPTDDSHKLFNTIELENSNNDISNYGHPCEYIQNQFQFIASMKNVVADIATGLMWT